MKVLKKPKINNKHQIRRVKSERKILENLKCPFIVGLHYAF